MVTTKFGLFNESTQSYVYLDDMPVVAPTAEQLERYVNQTENLTMDGHTIKKFRQKVQVIVEVNPTAQTGDAGILEIVVFSQNNVADRVTGRIILNLEVQTIHDIQFGDDVELYHDLEYPDKQTITIPIVNQGNTRTEFIIYTPEGFRGWSVLLEEDNSECRTFNEDLKCTLDTGASTEILVNVRPPNNAEIKDNFTFTLSVEPVIDGEPMIVGRENIEISVLGEPDQGLLGLGLSQEEVASGVYLIVGLLFLIITYRTVRPTISQMFGKKPKD